MSFHREKYRPRGGPDGGNGGRGGSVVLVADINTGSLAALRDHPHQKAKPGGNGARNNRTGADSEDLTLAVPVGTIVKNEEGEVYADLALHADSFVVAKGGRGGRGNAAFVASNRRVPGFGELGEPGEERWIQLELGLIADVAVIGFPNAGKSTLVGAVSGAKPKIAAYPFTTIEPSLGVVEYRDERFKICDIPGLIEGAHEGRGLGIKFLKHAARAPVFVHLLDPVSGRDLIEDHRIVRTELASFQEDLALRPEVIVVNKSDELSDAERADVDKLLASHGLEAMWISAMAPEGLDELIARLWQEVAEARESIRLSAGFELFRTRESPIEISKEDHAWRVSGDRVERWVAMTDMSNPEAVSYLQNRLERGGIEKALASAGAEHGDEVRIGSVAFEWWPGGSDPNEASSRRRSDK